MTSHFFFFFCLVYQKYVVYLHRESWGIALTLARKGSLSRD